MRNTVHCIALLLRTTLNCPTLCTPSIVLHYSMYSSIILHCSMLSCIVLPCHCRPALHCAVLSCIVLSCPAYCTVQCCSSVSYTVKGRPAVSIFIFQCPTQSNFVSYCRALPLLSCSFCIVQSSALLKFRSVVSMFILQSPTLSNVAIR